MLLSSPTARAVVIGTATHAPGSIVTDVPSVSGSMRALVSCLVGRCGMVEANITVVSDPETPQALAQVLVDAASTADDVLLVYYIGHGVLSPAGELHLATRATRDLSRNVPAYQALPYSALREVALSSRARWLVVVLDCCFSGLAELPRPDRCFLLASAAGEELALAPEGAPRTAFTGALVDLLEQGDPAAPPQITFNQMHRSLERALAAAGWPTPRPKLAGSAGDLVLAPNVAYQPPMIGLEPTGLGSPNGGTEEENACPYRGLASYGEQDARFFFGRDELVERALGGLVARFGQGGPLVVVGASGAGKSSLIHAGLLPAVAGGRLALRHSGRWPQVSIRPGDKPMAALAARLGDLCGLPARQVEEHLTAHPTRITSLLATALAADAGGGCLLVVDQFEELFPVLPHEREKQAFIAALLAASSRREDGGPPTALVVLGLRADFYRYLVAYPALVPALQAQLVVGSMTAAELREAIEGPARVAGLALEPGLVQILLRDMAADTAHGFPAEEAHGRLPYLSHALLGTWQRRVGRVLTVAAYEATGGIRGAIAETAETLHRELERTAPGQVRRVLTQLISVGQERTVPRRVSRTELLAMGPHEASPGTIATVVDRLVAARLLTADRDTIEISHAALLDAWPQLGEWIASDRAGLLIHQQLGEASQEWAAHDRERSYLWEGVRLAATLDWADRDRQRGGFTPVERAFLDASRRRVRRGQRRRLQVAAALSVLAIVASTGGALAFQQQRQAAEQHDVALSRQLSFESSAYIADQPDLALLLAVEADRVSDSTSARSTVLSALQAAPDRYERGFVGRPSSLAFGPDGRRLAWVDSDGHVIIWDNETQRREGSLIGPRGVLSFAWRASEDDQLVTGGYDGITIWRVGPRTHGAPGADNYGRIVAMSPDGKVLAGAGNEGIAVWDAHTWKLLGGPLMSSTTTSANGVLWLRFSSDSKVLAAGVLSGPRTGVLFWDVQTRQRLGDPITLPHQVDGLAWSPDGGLLAVSSWGQVSLWDAGRRQQTGPPLYVSPTRAGTGFPAYDVYDLSFSPDGRTLAAAGVDGHTALWDVQSRQLVAKLPGTGVEAVAFSPDGHTLVAGDNDGKIAFWSLPATRTLGSPLPGSTGANSVAFSPDGQFLASDQRTGQVHIWSVENRQLVGDPLDGPAGFNNVAFSPDASSHLLAGGGGDGTIGLWDYVSRRRLATFSTGGKELHAIAFSPDGRLLAAGGVSDTIWLWDVRTRQVRARLAADSTVNSIAFSPDGKTLVSGEPVTLWDLRHLTRIVTEPSTQGAWNVAFSPDGQRLVMAGAAGYVYFWDTQTHKRVGQSLPVDLRGGGVGGLAISTDGSLLAAGTDSGVVNLWDLQTQQPVGSRLQGATWVTSLAFSPNGRRLAAGEQHQVMLWDTDPASWLRQACGIASRDLTQAEWERYLGPSGRKRQQTCPGSPAS